MKSAADVDAIMAEIPEAWRKRWCGGERGACACLGCVQIGNRAVMFKAATSQPFKGDPEYLVESRMPTEVVAKCKVSKDEWEAWCARQASQG